MVRVIEDFLPPRQQVCKRLVSGWLGGVCTTQAAFRGWWCKGEKDNLPPSAGRRKVVVVRWCMHHTDCLRKVVV